MRTILDGDGLRPALWLAVAGGLLGNGYLPLASAGVCVTSLTGLCWPLAMAIILTIITALALRTLPPRTAGTTALLGIAGMSVITVGVLNLLPPIARDELTHHLAIPLLYVRAGRVIELPFADQAYYPMLLQMLYTPLVAHGVENLAKYLHLGFALGASAIIYLYLVRRTAAGIALLAAIVLLTTPTVVVLSASAYVDLGLLFYTTAATVGMLLWAESGRRRDLIVSALAAGCAATAKYNGLLVIGLLGAAALLSARERGAAGMVRVALLFVIASMLPLVPWLVKNAVETGNPIFPLFNSLLGGRPLPPRPSIDVFTTRRMLYGESWLAVLTTPLRVFVSGRDGDPARFDGVLNPLYLLAFAAACLPRATRRDRALAGCAAVYLLLAFFTVAFRSRYVIPVLPPLVVLMAETLERWRRTGWRPQLGLAAIAVTALLFNLAHLALFWRTIDPLPYLRGHETRAALIARFVPEYPVAVFANSHLDGDARLHLAFLGNRGYYWARPYSYDKHFSGITLQQAVQRAENAAAVADDLHRQGITHLASADPLLMRFMRDNLEPAAHARWLEFVHLHLHLVYWHQGIGLYEIG